MSEASALRAVSHGPSALPYANGPVHIGAPARKVFLGRGVGAFGVDESDGQHGRKIDDHGQQNPEIVGQLRHLPNHDAKRLPPWQNYMLICVLICD